MLYSDPVIEHGIPQRLSPRVQRITATNAGPMTGPGTNTYLIGDQSIAVVDPGPACPDHIDAILAACGDRIRWILVTHTHSDHSPAAQMLAEATGAQVMGNTVEDDGFQDTSFITSHRFVHDEVLGGPDFTLRVLHTPGHVANHLCYLVEEDGLLLTGDHVMQGSTVVIIPPAGDMQAYVESLRRMLDYPLQALAPGHGQLIHQPQAEIERLIQHHMGREAKVVQVLSQLDKADLDTLVPLVYDDVDSRLHPVAQYSLWAHLIKLEREKQAVEQHGLWCWLE